MGLFAAAQKWQHQRHEAHLKNIKPFSKKIEKAVSEGKTECEVGELTPDQCRSFEAIGYSLQCISGSHVHAGERVYTVSGWERKANMLDNKQQEDTYGDKY